nr:PREDICTED: mediator of RNA polymerase II transcription subunit 9 [Opisthocomus hoazin]
MPQSILESSVWSRRGRRCWVEKRGWWKSYGVAADGSEHVHPVTRPLDATAVLGEHLSVPKTLPCVASMDKDSQDVHQVLNELKNKFQEMRKLISSMPGIGVSPEQQQQQLQNLREQVRTKNELLQKYKSLCMFEIPKE